LKNCVSKHINVFNNVLNLKELSRLLKKSGMTQKYRYVEQAMRNRKKCLSKAERFEKSL